MHIIKSNDPNTDPCGTPIFSKENTDCECTVCDISKKIQIGYPKIVANREKYNRRALVKLYSIFRDHSLLYASGLFLLLNNGNLKRIQIIFFSNFANFFCIFHLRQKT